MDDLTGKILLYGAKKKLNSFFDEGKEENSPDLLSNVKKVIGIEEEKKKKEPEGLLGNIKKTLGFEEEEEEQEEKKKVK